MTPGRSSICRESTAYKADSKCGKYRFGNNAAKSFFCTESREQQFAGYERGGKLSDCQYAAPAGIKALYRQKPEIAQKTLETLKEISDHLENASEELGNLFQDEYVRLANPSYKPYSNHRPSYRKGLVEEVWNRAKARNNDGKVRDPSTGEIIEWESGQPRIGIWDMGHIENEKYSIRHREYMEGKISLKQFLDWYNNPNNYQPELPKSNRSNNARE